jgi:chromosome segregation ATPase
MSSEAPLPSDTGPRSVSIFENDPDQKLAIYEQKLQDLETRRLESIDHAIILQQKVSSLEAKLLALEKEKDEALAQSKSKTVAFDELNTKLRDLESINSGTSVAVPKQDERLAELEAKTKTLEQVYCHP